MSGISRIDQKLTSILLILSPVKYGSEKERRSQRHIELAKLVHQHKLEELGFKPKR
jgi:hypothetical protein